jgi:Holliday junction resolvase RusA-like endonuclease
MTSLDTGIGPIPTQTQEPDAIEELTITVLGVPVPQGSKKGFARGKGVQIVDDNADVLKPWRKKVRSAAEFVLADRPGIPKQVPVFAHLTFYMPRPASVKRLRPSVKPDVDKLTRAIFDALTDADVWADDGQVVDLHVHEYYADDEPYVSIRVGVVA